jgi:hypothetical protein
MKLVPMAQIVSSVADRQVCVFIAASFLACPKGQASRRNFRTARIETIRNTQRVELCDPTPCGLSRPG